jgi:hypothetical protein
MKRFCENPACRWHIEVKDDVRHIDYAERGGGVLYSKTLHVARHAWLNENKRSNDGTPALFWLCDICDGAFKLLQSMTGTRKGVTQPERAQP